MISLAAESIFDVDSIMVPAESVLSLHGPKFSRSKDKALLIHVHKLFTKYVWLLLDAYSKSKNTNTNGRRDGGGGERVLFEHREKKN